MRCTEFTHPEPPAPLDEGSGAAKPTWCVKYLGAAGSARPQTGHGADIVGGWRWAGADLQGLQPFGRGTLAPAVWIWGRGMLPFFQLGLAPGDLGLWGRGGGLGRGAGIGENICDNPRRSRAKCGHRTTEGGMCWRLGDAVGAADFTKGDWSQLGHLDTWRILFSQLGLFGGDEGNDEKRSPKPMTKIPHHSCPGELCLVFGSAPPLPKKISRWDGGSGKREGGEAGSSGPRAPESGPLATVRKHMPDCEGGPGGVPTKPRAGAPSVAMN